MSTPSTSNYLQINSKLSNNPFRFDHLTPSDRIRTNIFPFPPNFSSPSNSSRPFLSLAQFTNVLPLLSPHPLFLFIIFVPRSSPSTTPSSHRLLAVFPPSCVATTSLPCQIHLSLQAHKGLSSHFIHGGSGISSRGERRYPRTRPFFLRRGEFPRDASWNPEENRSFNELNSAIPRKISSQPLI